MDFTIYKFQLKWAFLVKGRCLIHFTMYNYAKKIPFSLWLCIQYVWREDGGQSQSRLLLLPHLLERGLFSSLATGCFKLLCKLLLFLPENRLSPNCSTNECTERVSWSASLHRRRGRGRRKGGFFSAACAPALGGSSECFKGKFPLE